MFDKELTNLSLRMALLVIAEYLGQLGVVRVQAGLVFNSSSATYHNTSVLSYSPVETPEITNEQFVGILLALGWRKALQARTFAVTLDELFAIARGTLLPEHKEKDTD